MSSTIIGISTICLYLISTSYMGKEFNQKTPSRIAITLAWLAVLSHTSYNILLFSQNSSFNFSFFHTLSFISSLVALLLLLASITKPVEKLGIVIFPIAAIMLSLDMIFFASNRSLQQYDWQMNIHILTSITAFSLFSIAALQAILLTIQDKRLKNHSTNSIIHALPPLQTMETLLFQMIGTGLAFLTLSLISGFVFIEDLFAQHLVHKTVLSIFAWLIFSGLLLGRIHYGWRGQTAMRWTLAGFISLLLAYLGSKFVLELILKIN
ncbi:MAG: cytochrome c biogenesis protein CcsA [Methylococcales bacterium]|nr:cytochrome c biogenesis protein CcsA [Methylococcales bacterium]